MNQNQDLKMQLLKEFADNYEPKSIDFCREAYKFLTEDDKMKMSIDANGTTIIENIPVRTEVVAVDLGLPSGTLWADRNIGAVSPEDVGLYFSWGNTDGHVFGTDYDFEEDYENTEGSKLEDDLDLEHDAARVNMGEPWQLPTSEQFQELDDNCTHDFVSLNGYKGMRFTSKINGNSIFFPCSGIGNGSSWNSRGSFGYYWSSSLGSATNGRRLSFYSGGVDPQDDNDRFIGFAGRAVQNINKK